MRIFPHIFRKYLYCLTLAVLLAALSACGYPKHVEPSIPASITELPNWERVRDAELYNPSFNAQGIRGLAAVNTEDTPGAERNAEWLKLAADLRAAPLPEQLEAINRYFNQWPYIRDEKLWNMRDYWATPAEFVARSGDCEDYAIAKYYALRFLGLPPARLRIAAVWNYQRREGHAVLLVLGPPGSAPENALVLDNFSDSIRTLGNMPHYGPVFYVNEDSLWLPPKKE